MTTEDGSWNKKVSLAKKFGFDTNRLPDGWICKWAVWVNKKEREKFASIYHEDRLDFPLSPINYKWLSQEMPEVIQKGGFKDYSKTEITGKGVNVFLSETVKELLLSSVD